MPISTLSSRSSRTSIRTRPTSRGPLRFAIILSAALAAVVATYTSGCTTVSCDQGTIERNGKCEPSDINTDPAICGPGTVLVGDRCESSIMCGSGTAPQPDPSDPTKTICVGT